MASRVPSFCRLCDGKRTDATLKDDDTQLCSICGTLSRMCNGEKPYIQWAHNVKKAIEFKKETNRYSGCNMCDSQECKLCTYCFGEWQHTFWDSRAFLINIRSRDGRRRRQVRLLHVDACYWHLTDVVLCCPLYD